MRPLGAKQVFAPAEGPADLLNAPEAAAEPRREAIAVFIFVGDEVRSGEEVQKEVSCDEALVKRKTGGVFQEVHRQLPAAGVRAQLLEVQQAEGIERLDAVDALVGVQPLTDRLCEGKMIAIGAFQFNDQGRCRFKQRQCLVKERNLLVRSFQPKCPQLLEGQIFDHALRAGAAREA